MLRPCTELRFRIVKIMRFCGCYETGRSVFRMEWVRPEEHADFMTSAPKWSEDVDTDITTAASPASSGQSNVRTISTAVQCGYLTWTSQFRSQRMFGVLRCCRDKRTINRFSATIAVHDHHSPHVISGSRLYPMTLINDSSGPFTSYQSLRNTTYITSSTWHWSYPSPTPTVLEIYLWYICSSNLRFT